MNDRIGFSTTTNWLSRLIRWFTQASVSHAWLLYFDVDFGGREMVLEATLEGVRIIPFEIFKKKNIIVKITTPSHDLKRGLALAGDTLGSGYDFTGLFGMLWVTLGRWFKKKWKNPWERPHSMFCSEFVAQVLKWSSYPGTDFWDVGAMAPQDLYEFFMRQEIAAATTKTQLPP